jgi:hypothetical protein
MNADLEEVMRNYQKDIEAGIRDAYERALECERIPQRWIVVCRVNADGDVSVVDGSGSSSVRYFWDADGWHVVAMFHTEDITPLKDALAAFRREIRP